MVAVTDLSDLQGLADSASAHVNGQLLLLPQNPGVKKWFGTPVPFSSRYAILHMRYFHRDILVTMHADKTSDQKSVN